LAVEHIADPPVAALAAEHIADPSADAARVAGCIAAAQVAGYTAVDSAADFEMPQVVLIAQN